MSTWYILCINYKYIEICLFTIINANAVCIPVLTLNSLGRNKLICLKWLTWLISYFSLGISTKNNTLGTISCSVSIWILSIPIKSCTVTPQSSARSWMMRLPHCMACIGQLHLTSAHPLWKITVGVWQREGVFKRDYQIVLLFSKVTHPLYNIMSQSTAEGLHVSWGMSNGLFHLISILPLSKVYR